MSPLERHSLPVANSNGHDVGRQKARHWFARASITDTGGQITSLPRILLASLLRQSSLELLFEDGFGHCANHRLDRFAVIKDQQRRDTTNSEVHG